MWRNRVPLPPKTENLALAAVAEILQESTQSQCPVDPIPRVKELRDKWSHNPEQEVFRYKVIDTNLERLAQDGHLLTIAPHHLFNTIFWVLVTQQVIQSSVI